MDDFLQKLGRRLAELDEACSPTGFAVAFSGGLDSSVLLAGCRRLKLSRPLRALHVDHGLHPDSAAWARACAAAAAAQGVDFVGLQVTVDRRPAESLEAVARERRYAALAERLRPGEMLLTAHHRGDQLETLLMRLFRGTGVRGLRGILASGPFACGYLGRPLLDVARHALLDAATAWGLSWLDDPANLDPRFDRNYLRSVVVPAIEQRWPGAAGNVSAAAVRMAEAECLLEQLAAIDARGLENPARVPVGIVRAVDLPRQRNLLRYLLTRCELPLPNATQLAELVAALGVERRDAQVCVRWPGAEARLFAEHLYLMAALPDHPSAGACGTLHPDDPWVGPEGRLELHRVDRRGDAAGLPDAWINEGLSVRFRTGGERLRLPGASHRRELKKLLQEAHVVPWMRVRIPLLFRDDELVAVGDLWVADAPGTGDGAARGWRVRWTEHPTLY